MRVPQRELVHRVVILSDHIERISAWSYEDADGCWKDD